MSEHKLHKRLFSVKASHRLVVFCVALLIIALLATFISFFIPKTAARTTQASISYHIDALGYKTESLAIGTTTLSVEVSDTDALRDQGLSNRTSLGADQGMLFVFQSDSKPGFWMKDMDFPLDMVWIDASGRIVDITHDLLPSTYPSSVYPKSPVRYVLEVNAGFASAHGMYVGEAVKTF